MVGIVIALLAVGVPILLVVGLFFWISGASLPIRNGVHTEATIEAWADTGMYQKGTGNFGSIYKLRLLVTPVGGGAPVTVEIKSTIDRIIDPDVGYRLPVIVSPTNPRRVKVDHSRTRQSLDKGWHTTNDDAGSLDELDKLGK